MSERIDRRIGNNRFLLGVVMAIFAVASVAGIFFWMRSTELQPPPRQDAAQKQSSVASSLRPDEPVTVTLFYPAADMLSTETVAVKRKPDTQAQAHEVLAAMMGDSRAVQSGVFKDMKLRELFLDSVGTAYVDLAPSQQNGVKASAWDELLEIYAIVDTLIHNFEEIRQVRFLLDGREAQTLAGHIDLSRKFEKRMDLVKQ